VIAHRGGAAAPENSIACIEHGISDGADMIEIERSGDRRWRGRVFHDSDFMRLAGVDLKIWDATVDRLREIDIGARFSPESTASACPRSRRSLRCAADGPA